MTFEAWLKQWVSRHPLKPAASDAAFTAGVMSRVRDAAGTDSAAAPRLRLSWFSWPRLSFALAAAAAGVMVAVSLRANGQRLAGEIFEQGSMLTLLTDGETVLGNGGDELTDADAQQLLQLAENTPAKEDAGWLEEIEAMSKLLNELDEELPASDGGASDEGWERELQMLEESTESAAS